MLQIARNLLDPVDGFLRNAAHLYLRVGRPSQVKLRDVRENPGEQPEL